MQIVSLPLITGDGSKHALAAAGTYARWVQVVVRTIASSSVPVEIGDAAITTTRGIPLFQVGASQFFPEHTTDSFSFYDLAEIYQLAASGDTISVVYGI